MPSTDASHLRWWQWIGPWPLRPVALGVIAAVIAFTNSAHRIPQSAAWKVIGAAILVGVTVGTAMWVLRAVAAPAVARPWGYAAAVIITAGAGNTVRLATGTILDFPNLNAAANFVSTTMATVIFFLFILALLGASQRRLQIQVDRGDEALVAMKRQADALLAADEQVRHQVALLLHDRVQAGLIAACLQLRRTVGSTDDEDRDGQVRAVVDQLEQLRALDVRSAVHALSPNLREVDLVTALDDLADTYRPAMEIDVVLTADPPISDRAALGIYRIVEQALLNAAVHGRATSCSVCIEGTGAGGLALRVTDNGAGLPREVTGGFGTTLIDTWARVLGGTWSRRSAPAGTLVEVYLP